MESMHTIICQCNVRKSLFNVTVSVGHSHVGSCDVLRQLIVDQSFAMPVVLYVQLRFNPVMLLSEH